MSMKRHYTKLFYIPMSLLVGLSQSDFSYADSNEDWPIVNGAGQITESPKAKEEPRRPADATNASDLITTIDGDSITGFKSEELVATGNAVVIRGDQQISADKIVYRPEGKRVHAVGNVILEQPGLKLLGEELSYSAEDETGEIDIVQYFLGDDAHGTADKTFIESEERQRALSATYSTCDVANPEVYLKASVLDLDRTRDSGSGKNTRIVFKGVPILYSPYITFPLSEKRRTGLLAPSYTQSVENGFEVAIPFYWDIAPNYDATITARNMASRGTQFKSEWRYLQNDFLGQFDYDYIGDDRLSGERRRSYYRWVHQGRFGENFLGYVDFEGVSDDTYFTDLSTDLSETSKVHLPRKLGLSSQGPWWRAGAEMIHYQTLNFQAKPYQIDPSIKFSIDPQELLGFEAGGDFGMTRYYKSNNSGSTRSEAVPYLQWPLENDFLNILPKIKYNITNYENHDGSHFYRALPIYSIDSSVVLERDLQFVGAQMKQTLEPRIFYAYAPYRDQSNLPNFDSSLRGFDFSSIFTDNVFSGSDRINDADHVTLGVTSRFIDEISGQERLSLSGAQRYFIGGNEVSGDTANRSDILAAASGRVTNSVSLDSLIQYSGILNQVQRHQHAIRYRVEEGGSFNFIHRSDRDLQEQFDMSGQWFASQNWSVAGRWNYSKDSGRLIEGLMGLEYDESCWGASFVASKVLIGQNANGSGKYATQFMFQLDLKGFTRVGQNATGFLSDKVGGYRR